MAGSRLEKIGTIYTRTTGLIQSKALNWDDRPVWYDVYSKFPPKEEPSYDRPVPNMKLRQIFYEDDKIRATFHRNNKKIGAVHLLSKTSSLSQRFIETYKKIKEQYKDSNMSEEHLYKEAIGLINHDRRFQAREKTVHETEGEDSISLSTAFKEARAKLKDGNINIKNIFKD
ncbi:small ribosomal subunit protein mS23 [Euwallacea fornicatus]|uniref:small ribosomal subunit protein mS23 n=1 Tax=Euwallacea fornicatus TaxID=995702 RepID=UPI00338E1EFD